MRCYKGLSDSSLGLTIPLTSIGSFYYFRLLVTVTISYMITWCPYYVFQLLHNVTNVFDGRSRLLYMVFGLCHMIAMCSAICNPMLYGFMNDNLRPAILSLCKCVFCKKGSSSQEDIPMDTIASVKLRASGEKTDFTEISRDDFINIDPK